MGNINFDGVPPYETLFAKSIQSKPTQDGIELTVDVYLADGAVVPIQIVLEPKDAAVLGPALTVAAGVVKRWQQNQ